MNKKLFIYLGGVAIVGAVLFFLWFIGQTSPDNQPLVAIPKAQLQVETVVANRDATLYFASPDASHLVSATTRIGCDGEQSCLREVVEALIRGPLKDSLPVIPARTSLNDVRVEEDMVVLDFDYQLVDGHPGGSQSELLTVYALANSIAVNFPHLRQVKILIDGAVAETLKGHVDLRRPLLADFTYSKRVAESDAMKEE